MRLNHVPRYAAAVAAVCAISVIAAVPGRSFTIQSPTEGEVVRGQVPIMIPRSSLPSDVTSSGFLVVKINDEFAAAVGATDPESSDKEPASPSIVYDWDTKSAMRDISGTDRPFTDGRYEIVVEAHSIQAGQRDTIVGSAKVTVVVKNKVDQPNPAPPIDLSYRYILGQVTDYKFTTTGEVFDKYGFSLSGGQPPIMGEFDMTQSIEDARDDGTALVRYKVDKDAVPYAQTPDQTTLLGMTQKFRSIYKIIDTTAKVVEANVFSTKSAGDVTDCLVPLPGNPVKTGTSWPSTFHLKLEGLAEGTDLTGQSTFDSLEWEGGLQCVKIISDWSGNLTLRALSASPVSARCTGTAYFAYGTHKLIKNVLRIEFSTDLDSSTVAKLQSTTAAPSSSAGSPAPAPGMPGPGYSGFPPMMRAPAPASPAAPSAGESGTPVKVQLVVTEQLVRK